MPVTLLEKLRIELDKNLQNEQFGVEELAEKVGMSRSNLHRKLQEASGQSVSQFIREYRLQRAMEILQSQKFNVSEVAHQVGFSSSSYFSKRFTEYYGHPPVEINKSSGFPTKSSRARGKRMRSYLVVGFLLISLTLVLNLTLRTADVSQPATPRTTIAVLPSKNINAEAYNYLLRGNDQSVNRSTKKGIETAFTFFKKAIDLDPGYVDAYIELANLWLVSGAAWGIKPQSAWDSAQLVLAKVLELDPKNGKAYHILAAGQYLYDWDFKNASINFNKAEAYAHESEDHWDFDFYTKIGYYKKVLALVDIYIQQNPLISRNYYGKAQALYFLGRKEEAVKILDETNDQFDDFLSQRECVKLYYLYGETDKFLEAYQELLVDYTDRPPLVVWLGAMQAIVNGDDPASYIDQLQEMYEFESSGSPAWFIALTYAKVNDDDRLFHWLEKSYKRREVEMTWLKVEPVLDPFKNDPRYLRLVSRMNFPG